MVGHFPDRRTCSRLDPVQNDVCRGISYASPSRPMCGRTIFPAGIRSCEGARDVSCPWRSRCLHAALLSKKSVTGRIYRRLRTSCQQGRCSGYFLFPLFFLMSFIAASIASVAGTATSGIVPWMSFSFARNCQNRLYDRLHQRPETGRR